MKSIITIVFLVISIELTAAPFNGTVMKFKQPDGSYVDVKLFGDEYYMRGEGLDDYTIIRDKVTQWLCYAVLSEDGSELLSSGIVYHGKTGDPFSLRSSLNIPKHVDISDKERTRKIYLKKNSLNRNLAEKSERKSSSNAVLGNIKGLCIVVDFPDAPGSLPLSEYNDLCNSLTYTTYGNNGSLRKYYSDISGGKVDYQNVVFGFYRAPLTFEQYDKMPQEEAAASLLSSALNWLKLQGFDFSTLTTDPNGAITAINLIYTGNPQNWSQGMWWHQGYYFEFHSNGVHSGAYNFSPADAPLSIATIVHENGHMIANWTDTYKYTNTNGLDGIGTFDLMANYGNKYNPVPPNPYFRCTAGWERVVDVTNFNGIITDTANSRTCFKYQVNNGDEFFLMESRRKNGRSSFIADEGLTIWHINRLGDNQSTIHEVFLEHANNDISDHTKACFRGGYKNEFSSVTTPGSAYTNGDPSGLKVWNISGLSDIMTYRLGSSVTAPILQLSFKDISGDNNGNGFLEPGESGNINVLATNAGQLNSGNTSVVCTALGSTASYITINTPTVNTGVLNASQMVTVAHNISIKPGTKLGAQLDLKFTISDGTNSTYFTKRFLVGRQVLMGNQQITTCSALFYDSGGPFSNYENMKDYTTTFSSNTVNQPVKVEFLSFDVEEYTNCNFDYLKVYNGGSTASPLLGTYCGINSPGTVISTDPSGKLTFQFHSDTGWRSAGWSALVSCSGTTANTEVSVFEAVKIFPNPSKGIINIGVDGELNTEISVTDISGRVVHQESALICNLYSIDLSDNRDGIYFLQLKKGAEVFIKKFIISK